MVNRTDEYGSVWISIQREVAFALANAVGYDDRVLVSLEYYVSQNGCHFGSDPRINAGAKGDGRPTWAICVDEDVQWWFKTID